jgi:hypothetical protein
MSEGAAASRGFSLELAAEGGDAGDGAADAGTLAVATEETTVVAVRAVGALEGWAPSARETGVPAVLQEASAISAAKRVLRGISFLGLSEGARRGKY